MSQERYFLHVDGTQRGPYTVRQVGHMVNSGIVHSGAMFWCEGLEQWQPVTQLIVPKAEVKRRRLNLSAKTLLGIGFCLLLLWICWPTLREGWREQHQVAKDSHAAYWRARGVLRESLGWFSGARFYEFDPSKVALLTSDRASVELEAQIEPFLGKPKSTRWRVELRYDSKLQMWVAAGAVPPVPPAPAPSEASESSSPQSKD